MEFRVLHREERTAARVGQLQTTHGVINTPAFMPVGTQASVKGISPQELREVGAQMILANAYHLYLRPGHELIRELGGLHRFMAWDGPILTDSGGYQVMSLAANCTVTDDGAEFKSHLDGSLHHMTPERSMEIQEALGADVAMVFDECLAFPASREVVEPSMRRTTAWAQRCREVHRRPDQALFGIIQGAHYPDLRQKSAREIVSIGFDGYAIGGVSVGEGKPLMYEMVEYASAELPESSPKYLMGVGLPEDLVECAARGIDLFDCVAPTRHGRTGWLYTTAGRIQIKNAKHIHEEEPIDAACGCYTCRHFSRAYLRHLFISCELFGLRLNTIHNLHMLTQLMREIREAINGDYLDEFRGAFYARRGITLSGDEGIVGSTLGQPTSQRALEVPV
ncbi:MAG: tRNA guanosine(34) transglycosylase Tgt [Nitrospiraceae bacterium]|nr:tRNA guanosine(34) transglycosylase Tgt [Nitrospiraceae bacterium]|tara:strand:- start:3394 stop:4575 length:1182 start_codon:yes stop_codon:yes gene_type:complete